MENESEHSVNNLLKNDFFVRWVSNPDEESNHYWTGIISRKPEVRVNINQAREILAMLKYKESHKLNDGEYTEILDALIRENALPENGKFSPFRGFTMMGVAATFLFCTTIAVIFYFLSSTDQPQRTTNEKRWEERKTRKGEKLTLKLSDGTVVKLNSGSALTFESVLNDSIREVFLQGEAYFDVKEDPKRPFVIRTGTLRTTVMGTEFNVRSYEDEKNIEVAVVEGKVKVENSGVGYVMLEPNEVSTYRKDINSLEKEEREITNLVAWNRNILVFENADAKEVWKKLEDWYGVNIIIENKRNIQGRYSGEYSNEPLETVLRGISFASGFDFEIDEYKNVIIK